MMFDYPQHSHVEISGLCNLKCPMCPLPKRKRQGGFMKPETLEEIGKQSVRKMKQIFFSMFGESCLHPKLGEMMKIARKYYDWVSVETNATMLDEVKAKEVMENGGTKLLVDCDTLNPEVYTKEIRPGADLAKTIKNIEGAIELRNKNNYPCRIEVQILLSKWSRNEIPTWVDFWEKRINTSYDTLRIKHWDDWSEVRGRANVYYKWIDKPWIKGRHLYFGEEDINDPNITVVRPGQKVPACMWRRYEVGITWDGNIVPCFRYCDYPEIGPLGNVFDEGGIKAAWDKAMKLYDNIDNGNTPEDKTLSRCHECTLRHFYGSLSDVSERFKKRENL